MIDNNSQWTLWCIGWALVTYAAYRAGGEAAACATLGAGFLRASGLASDSPFSTLIAALVSLVKPGAVKP